MSQAGFQYRGLPNNAIRIIELASARSSSRLHGRVFETYLTDSVSYEALSYVWGNRSMTREFETPEGHLSITESLFSSLMRLRHNDRPRVIQADSIYIDQASNENKIQQVMSMDQIYSKAEKTIVDLGAASENSELVCPLLKVVASDGFAEGLGQVAKTSGTEVGPPPLHEAAWEAFRALLRRRWFERVWTIQEFLLSPSVDIMCGDWTIKWKTLAVACRKASSRRGPLIALNDPALTSATQMGASTMTDLGNLRTSIQQRGKKGLFELLEIFRTREATDNRDHFYALLSCAKEGKDNVFRPDYKQEISEVSLRYASAFVNRGQVMTVLSSVGPHLKPCYSWIPDWTRPLVVSRTLIDDKDSQHQAGGVQKPTVRVEPTGELRILGTSIGRITSIGRAHRIRHELHSQIMKQFDELAIAIGDVTEIMASLTFYPTNENLDEVEWRSAVGNKPTSNGLAGISGRTIYFGVRALVAAQPSVGSQLRKPLDGKVPSEMLELIAKMDAEKARGNGAVLESYLAPMLEFLQGRKFCLTSKGHVGWVPMHAEAGDKIVVLYGGRVPFVRCKSTERRGLSLMVGECYIHGIMNGEAISSGFHEDKWVKLC